MNSKLKGEMEKNFRPEFLDAWTIVLVFRIPPPDQGKPEAHH